MKNTSSRLIVLQEVVMMTATRYRDGICPLFPGGERPTYIPSHEPHATAHNGIPKLTDATFSPTAQTLSPTQAIHYGFKPCPRPMSELSRHNPLHPLSPLATTGALIRCCKRFSPADTRGDCKRRRRFCTSAVSSDCWHGDKEGRYDRCDEWLPSRRLSVLSSPPAKGENLVRRRA